MRKEYNAPELKTVGQADQVVLGSLAGGIDLRDEYLIQESEFQTDQE